MPGRVGGFKNERARAHFLGVYRAAMAELPPVAESRDVATSFGSVRVHRFGGPPGRTPVILLPGRNASTPMWRDNIARLQRHRPVIGIDLLGEAGLSVQEKPIHGPDDEAQWLDEAVAGLGCKRVHLMGVSIGGWTATNYAARRPGGADTDQAATEAALISSGATHYTLRKAMPLDIPVLTSRCGPPPRMRSMATTRPRSPNGQRISGRRQTAQTEPRRAVCY